MKADAARALLKPWRNALAVDGIALGMSRDEVVASCSLSSSGMIVEQLAGNPMAVGAHARMLLGKQEITRAQYRELENLPPRLDRIECGRPGDDVVAIFAKAPSTARVREVHRFVNEKAGIQTVGTVTSLVEKLTEAYGKPTLEATQANPKGSGRYRGWIFRRNQREIACLVKAEAESGGTLLAPAIPAGGPCAAHLMVRLDEIDQKVFSFHLEMLNPDIVAYTQAEYMLSFNLPGPARGRLLRVVQR
jgi:hypothetical protein